MILGEQIKIQNLEFKIKNQFNQGDIDCLPKNHNPFFDFRRADFGLTEGWLGWAVQEVLPIQDKQGRTKGAA
ncbi:MAG: hypothetical protein J6A66_00990 [Alistipes sp.]|nr:hypothetical protein [Alistipes sp.]